MQLAGCRLVAVLPPPGGTTLGGGEVSRPQERYRMLDTANVHASVPKSINYSALDRHMKLEPLSAL